MLRLRLAALFVCCLACCGLRGAGWTPDHWFDKPLSPRIANYHIDASLDWEAKTLQGQETITWRNAGTAPTSDFPLHLYMNAFKGPDTLFAKEGGRRWAEAMGGADRNSFGFCRLKAVTLDGRTLPGHFGDDETVWWTQLPRAVQPGETVQIQVAWEIRFPRIISRSGWGGNFLMGSQWFPKVGVYQGSAWTCQPYHACTEFFSDFGTYDVALSLPNALLLAHTGTQTNFEKEIETDPNRKNCVIWRLHAEDVHDFAWAVMPTRAWSWSRFDYRGVQVFHFYQPENASNLERQRSAVRAALRCGAEWYFPYPYPVLTVLDLPEEAIGADGMEYPTLITAHNTRFDPFRFREVPEVVTIHETGHQWFYGALANDEVEHPWLDEGFTSWFTQRVSERAHHTLFESRRFQIGVDFPDWYNYWSAPSTDPVSQPGWRIRDWNAAGSIFYAKGALVLAELEAMVGAPVMEQVMRAYAQDMQFKHPRPQDFRRIAERVSGRDLGAFWRDFVDGTEILDYAIVQVSSPETLAGGWMDSGKGMTFAAPQPQRPGRKGRITLERRGGIKVPIALWVRLEDRTEHRVVWDGQERWVTYDFDSPVAMAILDPDGAHPMLKDRLHATWTARPATRGIRYWSQVLWGGFTALLQGIGLG